MPLRTVHMGEAFRVHYTPFQMQFLDWMYPGKWFWVDRSAVNDADETQRGTHELPFSSIDFAIGRCTANHGDLILCKPGHTDTISTATALAVDVAGVTVLGLGHGLARPILTLDTATTATIGVTAANCVFRNLVIQANFADIVSAFTVTAGDFWLDNCLIRAQTTNMNFLHLIDTNTTDNSADGLKLTGCAWYEPDAATLAMMLLDSAIARMEISDNRFYTGNATSNVAALITGAAGKNMTNLSILRNQLYMTGNAGSTAGLLITTDGTAGTGIIAYNNLSHLDATTEILITTTHHFGLFENRASAVFNAQGYLLPAVDA